MTNEHEMRLDLMLDAALAEYGAAEPLAGLEERVLGRLRAEPARAKSWWMWGAGIAAVAMLLGALLLMSRNEPKVMAPPIANNPARVEAPVPVLPPTHEVASVPQPHVPLAPQAVDNNLPKRDVFPSPTPPSEQELLLARYMRVTPRVEVMAQIQREPLKFQEDPWAPSTNVSPSTNEPMK